MKLGIFAELKLAAGLVELRKARHTLVVCPYSDTLPKDLPERALLSATLRRRGDKPTALGESPVSATNADGALYVWVMVDPEGSVFVRDTLLRKAVCVLLAEQPEILRIDVCGDLVCRAALAERAVYAAWVNGTPLPTQRKKSAKPLERILLNGWQGDLSESSGSSDVAACAAGNILARQLTSLPPNDLTPGVYRKRIKRLARQEGWAIEEFDFARLRKMGAGAFVAVAQGSAAQDAAIVHLSYAPKHAIERIALVGKGICFDTGGHNLKSAKYMAGMHEDMNGSAVTLGLLLAATRQKLPIRLDVWLAIAQNHLSPVAYKQGDIVRALNGTTIEVMHTDAEGRMVLADTLTLATRDKPVDLVIDFATLTGSMIYALGTRYAGVFASNTPLGSDALAAGIASGERVCLFPHDDDYESELDSKVADIKQCTLDGEADHILAARFLKRFVGDCPWLHVDLSAANCKGGLGAVASDQTGFGVAWGLKLLKRRLTAPVG